MSYSAKCMAPLLLVTAAAALLELLGTKRRRRSHASALKAAPPAAAAIAAAAAAAGLSLSDVGGGNDDVDVAPLDVAFVIAAAAVLGYGDCVGAEQSDPMMYWN